MHLKHTGLRRLVLIFAPARSTFPANSTLASIYMKIALRICQSQQNLCMLWLSRLDGIDPAWLAKVSNVYALLTKREVKMARYWPRVFVFFFVFFFFAFSSWSIKTQKKITKPISSHLDRTSLVNKGFIIWLYLQVKTTTTKQNRTRNCLVLGKKFLELGFFLFFFESSFLPYSHLISCCYFWISMESWVKQ